MVPFIIGLIIGIVFGFIVFAVLSAAGHDEDIFPPSSSEAGENDA